VYCERGVPPLQREKCRGGAWGGVGDVGVPVKHGRVWVMGRGLKVLQFGACCGEILTPSTIEAYYGY
jgi:hypothetical protein